jgi:hypothetical protein
MPLAQTYFWSNIIRETAIFFFYLFQHQNHCRTLYSFSVGAKVSVLFGTWINLDLRKSGTCSERKRKKRISGMGPTSVPGPACSGQRRWGPSPLTARYQAASLESGKTGLPTTEKQHCQQRTNSLANNGTTALSTTSMTFRPTS